MDDALLIQIVGAIVVLTGLLLLAFNLGHGRDGLTIKIGDRLELSTPGLGVIVIGALLLVTPPFIPALDTDTGAPGIPTPATSTPSPTSQATPTATPTSTAPPTPTPTLIERLVGTYEFVAWDEDRGPVTMAVSVKEGELTIDADGNADWELGIWDSGLNPSEPDTAPSRIRCGGRVQFSTLDLRWVPGGARNASINWEPGIESVRSMVFPAFCGGHIEADAPFSLDVVQTPAGLLLEMTNSEGAFRWRKVE